MSLVMEKQQPIATEVGWLTGRKLVGKVGWRWWWGYSELKAVWETDDEIPSYSQGMCL